MLAALLSHSSTVHMSLSRQTSLVAEALNEPSTLFTPFNTAQYQQLHRTQRRIWSLILTLHPALDTLLHTQRQTRHLVQHRLLSHHHTPRLFNAEMRTMLSQMAAVLDRCVAALQTGAAVEVEEMELVVALVVEMEAAFAAKMNEIAQNVREGKTRMLPSEVLVPLTVFLYSAVQLAEQVLILSSGVQRLLELERPLDYDDV